MENDRDREELRDRFVAGQAGMLDWLEVGRLVKARKDLRWFAEKALMWNVDKGNTA